MSDSENFNHDDLPPESSNIDTDTTPAPTLTAPPPPPPLFIELVETELLLDFENALRTIRQSSSVSIPGTFMHSAAATLDKACVRLRLALAKEKEKEADTNKEQAVE